MAKDNLNDYPVKRLSLWENSLTIAKKTFY